MDNQNIGKISVKTANRPRAKFNMKSDTTTTTQFGECQPVLVRQCQAGTKSVLSHDSLVRLAPMVAPCRARMGLRLLTKFVGMSDLTENWVPFITRQKVTRGAAQFIPNGMPSMALNKLSAMCLVGARMTLYTGYIQVSNASHESVTWRSTLGTVLPTDAFDWAKYLMGVNSNSLDNSYSNNFFDTRASYANGGYIESWGLENSSYKACVNLGRVFGWEHAFWIPINGTHMSNLFIPWGRNLGDSEDHSLDYVDIASADLVIPFTYTGTNPAGTTTGFIAVRLSSFGQRLRKILLGCGYELDFGTTDKKVSLMPLFAYYKAYYDSFALMLYENWENNPLFRLLRYYDDNGTWDFGAFFNTNPSSDSVAIRWWIQFICNLGACFYTEEQDYIGMHTRSLSVTSNGLGDNLPSNMPNVPLQGTRVVTNDDTSSQRSDAPLSQAGAQPVMDVSSGFFSSLDIEVMMKAYQCVNRESIAGKRLAEQLRLRGQGKYVDECKSSFVGETYVPINVDDVDATATGFDSVTGESSVLGEYTGKGVGYDEGQTFTYENDEYGYLITIATLIPDSGYVQQLDPQTECVKREDFYQPDYDGMGFEAITKRNVCGQNDFAFREDSVAMDATFGFAPRESKHKVPFSRLNGDFSRRGSKDAYLPYNLDKYIPQGDAEIAVVEDTESQSGHYRVQVVSELTPSRLSLATPNYRYVGRMPWLGFLNRIFNFFGKKPGPIGFDEMASNGVSRHWEFVNLYEDNFMLL